MILAGDIGGTKTLLALFEIENNELVERRKEKFTSSEYDSLESILNELFKDDAFNIQAAAFGVPGPVFGSKVKLTNLDWVLDQEVTSSYLKIENVKMINELGATAFAIPYLRNEELIELLIKTRMTINEEMISNPEVLIGCFCKYNIGLLNSVYEDNYLTGLATMSHCAQVKKVLDTMSAKYKFNM